MNDDRLTFSCILPTYNRCDVVEQTLLQLLACDYPDDRYEILVADNSSDGTPDMVERVARTAKVPVHLLRSSERLPAVKRNDAVRAASCDYVLLMNDDVWVRPDFLAEHERAHRLHPGPVAVLGHVEQSPQMPQNPFTEWYQPFAYFEIAERAGEPLDWRHFWTMNLSLPRSEMVDRNLMFHEDWAEIGSEDVELGYRWVNAGNTLIYHPQAWGEHYHPHTLDSACRLQETIGRGLRDLEVLIPEPDLLERYGILSFRNRPRAVARGLARQALFNGVTVPPIQRRLSGRKSNNRLSAWTSWKVLLHYTNRGYRGAAPRHPVPLATRRRVKEQTGS
jgi:GT2 family glycosyltransferase